MSKYFMGVDIGKSNDYSVSSLIRMNEDKTIEVLETNRKRVKSKSDRDEFDKEVKDTADLWNAKYLNK